MKEIEKQVEDIEAHEVEELILDSHHFGKFTPELKAKIESYTNLCSLALNDCQLKSLENFPNLPKLAKLELIDNQLAANALNELPSFPELQSLSLGGNRIANIDEITALKRYTQLVELDFLGCHITNIQGYREKLFLEFPNLLILDNADKDGNEVDLDEDMEEDEEDGEEEDNDLDSEGQFIGCKQFIINQEMKNMQDGEEDEELDDDEEEDDDDDEEEEQEPELQKKQKK